MNILDMPASHNPKITVYAPHNKTHNVRTCECHYTFHRTEPLSSVSVINQYYVANSHAMHVLKKHGNQQRVENGRRQTVNSGLLLLGN